MKLPTRGKIRTFLAFKLPDGVFIILIIVGILIFMSMINIMLSSVEHDKSYIASAPGNQHISNSIYAATANVKQNHVNNKVLAVCELRVLFFVALQYVNWI